MEQDILRAIQDLEEAIRCDGYTDGLTRRIAEKYGLPRKVLRQKFRERNGGKSPAQWTPPPLQGQLRKPLSALRREATAKARLKRLNVSTDLTWLQCGEIIQLPWEGSTKEFAFAGMNPKGKVFVLIEVETGDKCIRLYTTEDERLKLLAEFREGRIPVAEILL